MKLSDIKSAVAAYLGQSEAALTVGTQDLFLFAVNNARRKAELLHNFEMSRVTASLTIVGASGGALADAVIEGNTSDVVVVTGTLSPDATGTYVRSGNFGGYPLYMLSGATSYFIYYNANAETYILAAVLSTGAVTDKWQPATDLLVPVGAFVGAGANTGTATLAQTFSTFSGIKEVVAVGRVSSDGMYIPTDFTRNDIAIERERSALDHSDAMWVSERFPSDADILARGSAATIVQQGGKLLIYPISTASVEPVTISLVGYGWLSPYTAATLSVEDHDFMITYGHEWLLWSAIIELNHKFKVFVPRTEGNLTPPDELRDRAWRDLILWDTYLVDSHLTRTV